MKSEEVLTKNAHLKKKTRMDEKKAQDNLSNRVIGFVLNPY